MGLVFPKKNELYLTHRAGIEQYGNGWALSVKQDDTEVTFAPRAFKGYPTIHLPIKKIISAKEEIFKTEQDESAIARAIVGNYLFGETGAIVGAMTAKKRKVYKSFYVIRYKTDEDPKAIVLSQQRGGSTGFNKWNKTLNAKLPKEPEKPKQPMPKDITL